MPWVRCGGSGGRISVPGVPCRRNRNVDLNVVDDANGGFGEILARGARLNPRVHVAFIGTGEIRSDVFVNDEMLAVAAPVIIRADIIGGARFDIVDPSRRGDSNRLGTTCVDTGCRAVGRGSRVSCRAGRDFAVGSGDGSNRARFAGRSDGRIPSVCGDRRAVRRISD